MPPFLCIPSPHTLSSQIFTAHPVKYYYLFDFGYVNIFHKNTNGVDVAFEADWSLFLSIPFTYLSLCHP